MVKGLRLAVIDHWSARICSATVEDNDNPFKLIQSDLDELELLNSTLVSDGTSTDNFTDANQTLSVADFATVDYGKVLNHCKESHDTDITSDNNDDESSEKPGPPGPIMKNGKFNEGEAIAFWKIKSNHWGGIW